MLARGDRIADRWTVERKLGAGGLGAVYLCQDDAGREAAVKLVLSPVDRLADSLKSRTLREAKLLAELDHPNIVDVLGVGEDDDRGLVFLEMEVVNGVELSPQQTHVHGALDVARLGRLLSGVLDALIYAHGLGVAHRDLKHQNILVRGPDQQPVLVDWGNVFAGEDARLTRLDDSQGLGRTDHYAPPEALLNPGGTNPFSWDLYSVGVIAAVLGGAPTPLYDGTLDAHALAMAKLAAPVELDASLPLALRDLVAKATAPMPRDRFRSAQAMRAAVDAMVAAPHDPLPPGARPVVVPASMDGGRSHPSVAEETVAPDAFDEAPGPLATAPTIAPPPGPITAPTSVPTAASDAGTAPVFSAPTAPSGPSVAPREPVVREEASGGWPMAWIAAGLGLGAFGGLIAAVLVLGSPDDSVADGPVEPASMAVADAPRPMPPVGKAPVVSRPPSATPPPAVPRPALARRAPPPRPVASTTAPRTPAPAAPSAKDAHVDRVSTLLGTPPGGFLSALAKDPALAAQTARDLNQRASTSDGQSTLKDAYRRLLAEMQRNTGQGVLLIRGLAAQGALDSLLAVPRQGQGGAMPRNVLHEVAKQAPASVRAPDDARDCRRLVLYMDHLGRPDVAPAHGWIEGACGACAELGEPIGFCEGL